MAKTRDTETKKQTKIQTKVSKTIPVAFSCFYKPIAFTTGITKKKKNELIILVRFFLIKIYIGKYTTFFVSKNSSEKKSAISY